jgi:hypothetical protein
MSAVTGEPALHDVAIPMLNPLIEPNPTTNVDDPQRSSSTDDPFSAQRGDEAPPSPTTQKRDRRMSKEWGE